MSKKEERQIIGSCASINQWELGELVILHSVVEDCLVFFFKLPTLGAKIGYIDHLVGLAVNHPAHIGRVFQILMMINSSLEDENP